MKRHLFPLLAILSVISSASAGSGTWILDPISGDWNTAANWSSDSLPTDIATFALSNITDISLSAPVSLSGITFDPGADAYTLSAFPGAGMALDGGQGIINNSGVMQNFKSAVVGEGAGGYVFFSGTITGLVSLTQEAGMGSSGSPGAIQFQFGATAGNATFHNLGATTAGGAGGRTDFFYGRTSADQSTIINEGATASGATGGATTFLLDSPTAGNATLIANGGSNGGGGSFAFKDGATGGTARAELFGNGYLDISGKNGTTFAIGSIDGDGQVYLGRENCSIGSNGLSTTFSGVIHPGASGGAGRGTGALTKTGAGTLTLTGANLYTAGTTVSAGTLIVSNKSGSGTGMGAVAVNGGTLGGSGTIAGAVTVNSGAFPAPAAGMKKQANLTIQSGLTFNSGATYSYTFKAKGNKARTDKVTANGVTINSGASFNFSGTAQGQLRQGLTLTVLNNTSANPIAGVFANLADGAVLSVNGNNFQASYEGGDGNDLTLTVQ